MTYIKAIITKRKNYFSITFGHCFEDFTCVYFYIHRYGGVNKFGLLYQYNFYEKLKNSIKEKFIDIEINRPEMSQENQEAIGICCRL